MTDWRNRLAALWERIAGRRRSSESYGRLRGMALDFDPASIQMPADEPWSGAAVAVMELSVDRAIATIVAVADGSVSMYLSTGGGVIGAGEHVAVRAEGQRFRTAVADSRGLLARTTEFPLPGLGQVRFHALVADDRFSGVAPEAALRSGRHPLSSLYAAGQDLLTEIRLASDPSGTDRG